MVTLLGDGEESSRLYACNPSVKYEFSGSTGRWWVFREIRCGLVRSMLFVTWKESSFTYVGTEILFE